MPWRRSPAQLNDAKAAVRYFRAYADVLGVDTSRIRVWGESAGGHLAALIALTARSARSWRNARSVG